MAKWWPEDVAVLVPVYNHAHRVGEVVEGLVQAGARVLTVDDGSTDGSGDLAAEAGAEHVLTLSPNQGKGAALVAGFSWWAERGVKWVLTCDADGQHTLEACRLMVEAPRNEHQIMIGRRDMSVAPMPNRFGRAFSNFWVLVACGAHPGDAQTGLRIYPLPETAELMVTGRRYHYEVEVLIRGAWAGLTFGKVEVPVLYPEDRITHFNQLRDNIRMTTTFTRMITRRMMPWPHQRVVPRKPSTLRAELARGLDPQSAALAAGLGAALGVAPIPGLQMLAAGYVALRLRLNMAVTLVASNISFGPLLAMWAALCISVGGFLRTGSSPVDLFAQYHEKLGSFDWLTIAGLFGQGLGDWALGSLIVMPTLALVVGFGVYAFASTLSRERTA